MTRDELDPLDEESKLELESEQLDEAADDLGAPGDDTSASLDIEPVVGDEAGAAEDDLAPEGALSPEPATGSELSYEARQQQAVDRFFEAYRAHKAAERAAAGESGPELLPADAPLRRKDGYFYAEPRRLPPPTQFEELVFSYSKRPPSEPTPEMYERWRPPDFLPKGNAPPSAGPPVPPAEPEIKVVVEVRLTAEARERIAEQAIAKAAQTHQNHTETVAKRLYELTREIRDREAARRVLYRR